MKYLMVLSVLVLLLHSLTGVAEPSEAKLSTPEETLSTYINALREGNLNKVLQCYYSEDKNFKFHLPRPIMIEKYQIIRKKIYTEKTARAYKPIPKAKAGDVELDVKEFLEGKEQMFTYLLRKFDKEWRIISHTGWNQPD